MLELARNTTKARIERRKYRIGPSSSGHILTHRYSTLTFRHRSVRACKRRKSRRCATPTAMNTLSTFKGACIFEDAHQKWLFFQRCSSQEWQGGDENFNASTPIPGTPPWRISASVLSARPDARRRFGLGQRAGRSARTPLPHHNGLNDCRCHRSLVGGADTAVPTVLMRRAEVAVRRTKLSSRPSTHCLI